MADSQTIAAYATAAGTLVLAVATFAAVRSANTSARTAEHAFEVALRPLLFSSRLDDIEQKIRWGDDHWAHLPGGLALIERVDNVVYLAMSLRNVGSGIAVIHSWRTEELPPFGSALGMQRPAVEDFRPQSRDLFVPPADVSFWQAAIRDSEDPNLPRALAAIDNHQGLMVDLLYGDYEGGQRAISRFMLSPRGGEQPTWLCSVVKHWNLDRPDPRD
jgi:hypothetical protein